MKQLEIQRAITLARVFVNRAEAYLAARSEEKAVYREDGVIVYVKPKCPKLSGAMRRVSMECSRQFAKMRQS